MFSKLKWVHTKFNGYYIYFIVLLGFVLRLRNILNRDFWYDEAFTGVTVKANFWEMIRITINDVHPPLYYIFLKLFSFPFDYSVLSIRFFSVIFGIAGIGAIYLFTKELFNRKAALFASFIAALSPFAIQYSQEGRMYALLSFFTVLGAYFFIKALKTNRYPFYVAWGILLGLSALTHYMGVIYSFIFYVVYILHNFFTLKHTPTAKNILLNFLPTKGIAVGLLSSVIIFSFWIKVFFDHLRYSGLNNMHWVRPAYFSDVFTTIQIFLFGSPLGELSAGMPAPNSIYHISNSSVLIGITLFFGFLIPYLFRKEKEKHTYLLILSFGFVLLIYGISLLGDDYFVSRYLITASYFIFIMIGVWMSLISLRVTVFSLLLYVLLLVNIVPFNYSTGYGQLKAHLSAYKNADFYVLNSFDYVIAKYYVGANRLTLYNIDWPQYNPYFWAAIGSDLKRTETYDDLKNNPNAIIIANIQKPKEKRNDKTFDPTGLQLIATYDNITLYKPIK